MRMVVVLVLAALAACRNGVVIPHDDAIAGHPLPFADAGAGTTVLPGTQITLDASGSRAVVGELTSFAWERVDDLSGATIADPTAMVTSIVLPVEGTYTFRVTVTDDDGATASSEVVYEVRAPLLSAMASGPPTVAPFTTVQLTGSVTNESGAPVTAQWSFTGTPFGSHATLTGATTLTPTFVPDAAGSYVVRLDVQTEFGAASAVVFVSVVGIHTDLGYAVSFAAYDAQLDRLIAASDNPPALHVVTLATGDEHVIALPAAPTGLSLEPNGARAAVASFKRMAIANLTAFTQVNGSTPLDIVTLGFGADNHVYFTAPFTTTGNQIRAYNVANRTTTVETGSFNHTDGQLLAHPDATRLYIFQTAANAALRYTIGAGTLTPDAGASDGFERPVTLFRGGTAFVDTFGAVFACAAAAASDLAPAGQLAIGGMTITAAVPVAGKLVTIGTALDSNGDHHALVTVYDEQTLALLSQLPVPEPSFHDAVALGVSADGSTAYAVISAGTAFRIYPMPL